jgi:hypothetical protein
MQWLKDELPQSPPRRRGRPKIDNTKLLNDVLMRWLEVGAPDGRNLDRATREIAATNAKSRRTTEKSLRDQLSRAMRDTWPDTIKRLRAAIDVSQQQGAKVPHWVPVKLRALEQRESAAKPPWAARFPEAWRNQQAMRDLYFRMVSKIQSSDYIMLLAKIERQQDEMLGKIEEVEREHRRRVNTFARAFDDLLEREELPAVIIDALYHDIRLRLYERLPTLLQTRSD